MNTHLHVGAWIVSIVLLLVVVFLYKQNNERVAKILSMILRLVYIVILITGIQLLWNYFSGSDQLVIALVKSFAGLWLIGAMEIVIAKTSRNERAQSGWIQVVIAFALTLVLGFGVLPM